MRQRNDPDLNACKEALSQRLLETLVRELQSQNPTSRRKAILRLDNLQPLAARLLPQIESLLADPDYRVRKAAQQALADLNHD